MATVEAEQASKHDDFFDDAPEKPTMNGHVSPQPEAEQSTAEPKVTQDDSNRTEQDGAAASQSQEPEVNKAATAGESDQQPEGDESDKTEQKQEGDGIGVDETADVQSTNAGVDTAQVNDVQDSQPHEDNKTLAVPSESEPVQPTEQTDQEPEQDQHLQQQQQQQETSEAGGDVTESSAHAPSAEPSEGDVPATPAPPTSRQSEYEEDFSETSDLVSARNTPAESKPEEKKEQEEEQKAEVKDANKSRSSSSSSSSSEANTPEPQQVAPVPQGVQEAERPSSTCNVSGDVGGGEIAGVEGTERVDSRAEAGQVIPVPPPEPETKKPDVDGRSSIAGADEMGDGETFRGEDSTEMIAPEGSEDCRGQGQWKSAEQQAISSAMLVSKSERELTEEAVKERDTLRQDHDALKAQLLALEADVDKKNEQILVDKEILARKDKEIAELQSELENSQSVVASSEADSSRVKDLQERLAVLARENEEKDKRVFKLEAELREAQTRLRETERRLLHAENNAGQEPPKSKTCVIM
ncbi:hypothetical protein ElyMa_000518300 [Elysia marginata]|uniref:Uncharacterized protein n=1 Tax=Elysia marginata TaxID=1093978 RepID=A0AAV4FXL0_9GAST|nr:hypothetical protein ElyMa_000518300 [Elysia marginata]